MIEVQLNNENTNEVINFSIKDNDDLHIFIKAKSFEVGGNIEPEIANKISEDYNSLSEEEKNTFNLVKFIETLKRLYGNKLEIDILPSNARLN